MNITRLGNRPLLCRATAPAKKNLRLRGRFDALASCLLERLRVREGGVVGTLSALKSNNPQEGLVVHCSELGEVFRTESPRSTPVLQGLNTSAFNTRAFRLIGAVFLSYNSGPNRLKYAHMRRIHRSISSQRSEFSWMMPPRYKNWSSANISGQLLRSRAMGRWVSDPVFITASSTKVILDGFETKQFTG